MALINCPKCGCKVSDKADACPKCGTPISGFSESLGNEMVSPAIPVDNQSEENEEQKFYQSILHLIESENYEDAFVGIDTLLAQSDHPDQYVGLKENVVEKWVKKLTVDADRYISNDMAEDANECIQQALLLKPNDAALLSRLDSIKSIGKKTSKPLIIGLSLLSILAIGAIIWFVLNHQENSNSDYIVDEVIEGEIEEEISAANNVTTKVELNSDSANYISDDLKMFQLRGPVKQVHWGNSFFDLDYSSRISFFTPRLITYRRNGQLSSISFFNYSYDFEYKGDKMIYSYARGASEYSILRDSKGRLIGIVDEDGEAQMLKWNDKGQLVNDYYGWNVAYGENNQISKLWDENDLYTFRYTKFDNHGNWTERVLNTGDVEVRTISYYGEPDQTSSLRVMIDGVNLRLRLGPGTDYDCLQDENKMNIHPEKGDMYLYLGEWNGFYLIDYKGHEVYVSGEHAHMEDN